MALVKDKNLIVRVSHIQLRQIEQAARRSGITVSDYVRTVLALACQSRTLGAWIDRGLDDDKCPASR